MSTVIGLDIGGTNLRIGLLRDSVWERGATYSTHELFAEGDEIARLGSLIETFRGTEKADAVSVGFPSPIAADGKTVLNAPNIIKKDGSNAFKGKNVADPLTALLGMPVLVNKDANHLLHYDAHTANADGILVGCYVGTGFGSAVMIDGQLFKGKNGSAMEAGHIPFYHGERVCGCGKTGCAECYCAGRAAREYLEPLYPGKDVGRIFREHADDEPVAAFVEAVAITVATLVNLFDPHMLFLGGGVLSSDFPKDSLSAAILRHTMAPWPREGLDIRYTQHDAFAGVVGAALCAQAALQRM